MKLKKPLHFILPGKVPVNVYYFFKMPRFLTAMRVGLCFIVVYFCLTPHFVFAGQAVLVAVHETAHVSAARISLKDVASISGSEAQVGTIGNIYLGRSPRPGKDKTIRGRRLLSMIKAAKNFPVTATISVPESVRITRRFQSVNQEQLKAMFYRFVARGLDPSEFRVRRFKVRGANKFPTGTLTVSMNSYGKKEMMGTVSLRAGVLVDGKKCGRLTLVGWVDRFAKVVCARRAVAHHTILTEADLTIKPVNMSELPGGLLTDMTQAEGQLAKVTIRPGEPIRACMLDAPPLVQKGDRIKILAVSDRLKVTTVGIAKNSGGMGEQIRVENLASSKTVVGRVTGESTVEVLF